MLYQEVAGREFLFTVGAYVDGGLFSLGVFLADVVGKFSRRPEAIFAVVTGDGGASIFAIGTIVGLFALPLYLFRIYM